MSERHLYIHVPFCARRCAYCDFSIAVRPAVPVDEYLTGLRSELRLRAPKSGWTLDTLYLGGGTPSRLGGEGIRSLLVAVSEFVTLAPSAEVTMEVNPEDVTPESARTWIEAGVNRFSLGIQTFDAGILKWMHRVHSVDQSTYAFETLRAAGATNISVDMIFALPDSLKRNWRADLDKALALDPEHISLYGLTVETGTPLQRWVDRGTAVPVGDDSYSQEFMEAHEILTSNGFAHYEVSNFSKPGFRSRHNSSYWSGAAYAALGPSAHSFDGTAREWNIRPYAAWLSSVTSGNLPSEGRESLTEYNRATERVYLGLRTTDGLALSEVNDNATINAWRDAGWATISDASIRLTAEGWLRLDSLASDLTLSRSNF
ncbi:MAG: radical SAM family heme chaperone HemW [Gemmatimonadaceae bacterium]|nr:radical SAM family heme chaperone HemW [Gemmatimonadaceae bacterium]